MKSLLRWLSIFLGVFASIYVYSLAQEHPSIPIVGNWQGTLEIMGTRLRVVFRIMAEETGYRAELDSPDQGAKGIAVKEVIVRGDSLLLMVPVVMGQYAGRWRADSSDFSGVWKQGGLTLPLILKSIITVDEPKRPQTPQRPFPYREEEVTFENKAAAVKLSGTLTLPQGQGPFAAVILLSGSGPQDRDEQIFYHRPFLILADHLTRQGFAVLRYDDRGVGRSTGHFATATSIDFKNDAQAAFSFLESRPEIQRKKIGLLGHSEGGMIATMLAAENPKVAFVIMLAGVGTRGDELLLSQTRLILKANGLDDLAIAKRLQQQKRLYQLVIEEADTTLLKQKLYQEISAIWSQEKADKNDATEPTEELIKGQIRQLSSPWFRFFLQYDPEPYLLRVKCPVLALNGELDLQVPASENLRGIEEGLRKGGNKKITTQVFPGLNHLFQTAKTGSPMEYAQIEETISPQVLSYIAQWLKKTM